MVCRSLSFKKIKLRLFFTFFISTFFNSTFVSAQSTPLEEKLVGSGLLTFSIFKFKVYTLNVYSNNQVTSFKDLLKEDTIKLVFKFQRDVDRKYLVKAWQEASLQIPYQIDSKIWETLQREQTDMKENEEITLVLTNDKSYLSLPKKSTIELSDKNLKKLSWVWLGKNEVGEKLAPQIFTINN